jgi:4-carboxymuconolactone decarboxylase
MSDAQKRAAAELAAGPRGGVRGPFVALLRSPELMSRLQKVGEYLRYQSALDPRIGEFVMLVVSRHWTQQFEWRVHWPLALKAGVQESALRDLAEGRRPADVKHDEGLVYDFCDELFRTHGVSDATFAAALGSLGERGVVDLIGLVGYFVTVSMVMNVARTPPPAEGVPLLEHYPL